MAAMALSQANEVPRQAKAERGTCRIDRLLVVCGLGLLHPGNSQVHQTVDDIANH